MIGCNAELLDGLTMFLRGVALVRAPVVLGIFLSETVHIVITIRLGENTCCGDGEVFAVALDDGGVWDFVIGLKAIAVNDDRLRTNLELIQGTMHRKNGGVEDVDLVYLLGLR